MRKFLSQHSIFSHLLVILQFGGIACCCYPVDLKNLGNKYWLVACTLGAALGLLTLCYNKIGNFSVYPEIKQHAKLITTGPYHYIRHPMYTSLLLMMLGIALYNYHWINAIGVVMVMFAVINKANSEEKLLLIRFEEYLEFQQKTCRFVPYIY